MRRLFNYDTVDDNIPTEDDKETIDSRVEELVSNHSISTRTALILAENISSYKSIYLDQHEEHLELLKIALLLAKSLINRDFIKISSTPTVGRSTIQSIGRDNAHYMYLFLNDLICKEKHRFHYKDLLQEDPVMVEVYNFFYSNEIPIYKFDNRYSVGDLERMIKYMDNFIREWRKNPLKQLVKGIVKSMRSDNSFDNDIKTIKSNEASALYDCLVWAGYGEELNKENIETTKEKYDKIKHMLY